MKAQLITVNRWFKKPFSSFKNLDDPERLGQLKNVDSKTVLLVIGAHPVSSTWSVSGELSISQTYQVYHLNIFRKMIPNNQIRPYITKIVQNFWLTVVLNSKKYLDAKVFSFKRWWVSRGCFEWHLCQHLCHSTVASPVTQTTEQRWCKILFEVSTAHELSALKRPLGVNFGIKPEPVSKSCCVSNWDL